MNTRFLNSILLIATLGTAAGAQNRVGWVYAATSVVDSAGKPVHAVSIKQYIVDGVVRTDLPPRTIAGRTTGPSYLVINDFDHLTMSVDLGAKTVIVTKTTPTMASTLPATKTLPGGTFDLADLGPGERIAGYATHKYRLTSSNVVDISSGTTHCQQKRASTSEVWVAPDVDFTSAQRQVATRLSGLMGLSFPPDTGGETERQKGRCSDRSAGRGR